MYHTRSYKINENVDITHQKMEGNRKSTVINHYVYATVISKSCVCFSSMPWQRHLSCHYLATKARSHTS
jgi:hypothetical protein